MQLGVDYDLVHKRRRAATWPPGGLAYWAWNPMWDVAEWREKSYAVSEVAKIGSLLILPPGPVQYGNFDEVWQLRDHMMVGARGQFSSPRAELALTAKLKDYGGFRLMHSWPSYLLEPKDYLPLMTDREMVSAFTRHQRKSLNIRIEKVK